MTKATLILLFIGLTCEVAFNDEEIDVETRQSKCMDDVLDVVFFTELDCLRKCSPWCCRNNWCKYLKPSKAGCIGGCHKVGCEWRCCCHRCTRLIDAERPNVGPAKKGPAFSSKGWQEWKLRFDFNNYCCNFSYIFVSLLFNTVNSFILLKALHNNIL